MVIPLNEFRINGIDVYEVNTGNKVLDAEPINPKCGDMFCNSHGLLMIFLGIDWSPNELDNDTLRLLEEDENMTIEYTKTDIRGDI